MTKRYLVFGGERYYASGGWNDFIGSCDTVAEATSLATTAKRRYYDGGQLKPLEWWHIVDTDTGQIRAKSENGPY